MSKAELGLDTLPQEEGAHPSVILPDAITGKDRVLQLKSNSDLFAKRDRLLRNVMLLQS